MCKHNIDICIEGERKHVHEHQTFQSDKIIGCNCNKIKIKYDRNQNKDKILITQQVC